MVITVTLQHIYRFPVELVFKSYNDKYNLKSNDNLVENVDKKEEGGMECVKRIFSVDNFFPALFQRIKLLKTEMVVMEEECWSEINNRRYWIRSRNITWEDEATIANSSFLSPDENTKDWTKWEQESFVDFSSLGKLGKILELYMKRHIEFKMKENIKDLEQAMSSNQQNIPLSTNTI